MIKEKIVCCYGSFSWVCGWKARVARSVIFIVKLNCKCWIGGHFIENFLFFQNLFRITKFLYLFITTSTSVFLFKIKVFRDILIGVNPNKKCYHTLFLRAISRFDSDSSRVRKVQILQTKKTYFCLKYL